MSDSDEDIMAETLHRLQHNIMNSAATNMNNTNFNYSHNSVTSTFKSNNNRISNGLQSTNREHMYFRRETSPMSLKSFRDSRPQSFRNYPGSVRSHISVYNGRGGSPMSMRSVDSNVLVGAVDIAQALNNTKFNEYDLKLIKEAYNRLFKNQARKRIGKRKRQTLYVKGRRRKRRGYDSGEQGSESSMSSDDCRSTRTFESSKSSEPRSSNMDITHFRSSIRDCDMYRDHTEILKQTRLQNILALINTNEKHDTIIHQNQKCNSIDQKTSQKNISNITLKEVFTKDTNSFLLPSQRFDKSVVNLNNNETSNLINQRKNIQNGDKNNKINQQNIDTDSENEKIFSQTTIHKNPQQGQQKRFLEDSEAVSSDKKKYKATSPITQNNVTNLTQNDFLFKRPQRPAKKSASNKRESVPEMIIAMSKPVPGSIHLNLPKKTSDNLEQTHSKIPVNSTEIDESSNQTEISQNTTDVSMRPSFIKRKLFTQKLDVAEKNLNSDNVGTNSPQTKLYSGVQKKNKVRKLVTSQSCLSRDVLCDDNVLDLIHKIVPPDQINATAASKKREINRSNENDKWDIASVISTCNTSDISDTFTDEEIFKASSNLDKRPETIQQTVRNVKDPVDLKLKNSKLKIMTPCKVAVQKLPIAKSNENPREIEESNCLNKKTLSKCIKSFWDTDYESDMEEINVTLGKSRKCVIGEDPREIEDTVMNVVNEKNNTSGTILTIKNSQNETIKSSTRSDIGQVLKKTIIQENKKNNIIAKDLNKDTKNEKYKPTKKDSKCKLENENMKTKSVQTKNKATNKENICNTSRESLRLKEKNEKKDLTKRTCRGPQMSRENDDDIKTNKLNTSRESLRLKEKNEKKDLTKRTCRGPQMSKENNDDIKTNKLNTSRESLRLKEKNEKKDLAKPTCRGPQMSKENDDDIKLNKPTSRNNKSNNKNNNNNDMKNNNNLKVTSSVKKNKTIKQTPKKKQQTRNLFDTPVTQSSFNITNRSLRVRCTK